MTDLYPLRFQPSFRQYLWGGRRLGTVLGKPIGEGDHYAESWEVVDHGEDQSVVANGPFAGQTLHQLVIAYPNQVFGARYDHERFPLLLKYLDCQQNLSVQVHPNDQLAARLVPPDSGKTEAWVVLEAPPNSLIYAGFKHGFDRHAVERELNRGTIELCLHRVHPRPGDCLFIPAGVVHALGAGLLVAEIQQSSRTTYRLYDWNRVDQDGRPRSLHIAEALEAIDFDYGPVFPEVPRPTDRPHAERLVACDKFVLDRWHLEGSMRLAGDGRFHIITVLAGRVRVSAGGYEEPLERAETLLLPASIGAATVETPGCATLLDIYPPPA